MPFNQEGKVLATKKGKFLRTFFFHLKSSVDTGLLLRKVMDSILIHDLTNSPMEEMKQVDTNLMDSLVKEARSSYLTDNLVEVPKLFFGFLALSFTIFAFLIVGFVLQICLRTHSQVQVEAGSMESSRGFAQEISAQAILSETDCKSGRRCGGQQKQRRRSC